MILKIISHDNLLLFVMGFSVIWRQQKSRQKRLISTTDQGINSVHALIITCSTRQCCRSPQEETIPIRELFIYQDRSSSILSPASNMVYFNSNEQLLKLFRWKIQLFAIVSACHRWEKWEPDEKWMIVSNNSFGDWLPCEINTMRSWHCWNRHEQWLTVIIILYR